MNKIRLVITALCLLIPLTLSAQKTEKIDYEAIGRLKQEGLSNSQVMDFALQLSDVNGPRLTNSPGHKKAISWAVEAMEKNGLNAFTESAGEFGRGWSLDYFHIYVSKPAFMAVIAYPKAWVAGTGGDIVANLTLVKIQTEDDFEKYRGKLKGAIVFNIDRRQSGVTEMNTLFDEEAKRYSEEELKDIEALEARKDRRRRDRGQDRKADPRLKRREIKSFYREEGVAVILEPSMWDEHNLRIGGGGSHKVEEEKEITSIGISAEHMNRIVQMMDAGEEVEMNINVKTTFYEDDIETYNVIGEIPGNDPELKDEVVIIGGHLDSMHAGTGACDNAAGCAVAMEAARLIMAADLKPRRNER